jgi:thioesterase domain-containing protein
MAANGTLRNRAQTHARNAEGAVLGVGAAFRHAARKWQLRQVITDVNVVLLTATDRSKWGHHMEFDEDYGWRRLLGDRLSIVRVPGAHLSMMQLPNVAELARKALVFLGTSGK